MPAGPIPKHTITENRSPSLRSKNTHDQGGKAGSGGDFGGKSGGAPKVSGKPQSYSPPSGVFNRSEKCKPL